jgi:hypothetical protein
MQPRSSTERYGNSVFPLVLGPPPVGEHRTLPGRMPPGGAKVGASADSLLENPAFAGLSVWAVLGSNQ